MKRRIRVSHLILWVSFSAIAGFGLVGHAGKAEENEEARDFRTFTGRVQAYVKLQKNLEASLSTLKPTKDAEQIVEHQHALAEKIIDARRDARQGDIFTPEVAKRFRKVIRKAFHGPEGRMARKTILSDSALKPIVLHVNDVYPDDMPLTTTPPTLMLKLPQLPPEVVYRIVGHSLTLQSIKARLVLDLIPNAIP
jgi:hypothetical protein